MTSRYPVCLFISTICWSLNAHAQESTIDDLLQEEELIRESYIGSTDLPDGSAFAHLLAVIASAPQHISVSLLKSNLDVSPEVAGDLFRAMSDAKENFDKATVAASAEAGCVGSAPRVYGKAAYAAIEAMDDGRKQVADRHLASFMTRVGPELSSKLSDWIDKSKSSITYAEFNQEKLHARLGQNGDVTLARMCSDFSNELGGVK